MRESASTDLREPQGSNPPGPPGPELSGTLVSPELSAIRRKARPLSRGGETAQRNRDESAACARQLFTSLVRGSGLIQESRPWPAARLKVTACGLS